MALMSKEEIERGVQSARELVEELRAVAEELGETRYLRGPYNREWQRASRRVGKEWRARRKEQGDG